MGKTRGNGHGYRGETVVTSAGNRVETICGTVGPMRWRVCGTVLEIVAAMIKVTVTIIVGRRSRNGGQDDRQNSPGNGRAKSRQ